MSDQVLGNSGGAEGAREDRGPSCSPCVPLPARRSPSEHRPSQEVRGDAERRVAGGPPARREPEVQSPESVYPRFVTPGIETQSPSNQVPEPGMWCRADWIRFVGPEYSSGQLYRILERWFGEPTGTSHGAKFFKSGVEWKPGVLLSRGHSSDIEMIDLQGSRLATMKPLDALKLTDEILMFGFHCTRIDLAVDHVEQGINLYENALESCRAGELCFMRRFSPDPEFKADGTPLRKLLKLGKRESEVCIRIYDKGLETKTRSVGEWERFEVEIKGNRAREVCMSIVQAGNQFNELLWEIVIGSVDFRNCNGRSELKRRPQCKWWSEYIGQSKPKRIKPVPSVSGLNQWCEWFRRSVGPRVLQLSMILGITPQRMFDELIESIEPARSDTAATVEARARVTKFGL